jgi:lysophospholipase L1-like esterase
MLMIGTNNVGSDSPEQIADGVKAIIKTIQEKSPHTKVLLLAVFPRANLKTGERNKKIDEINAIIKNLHHGQKVKYLDIGQKFLVDGNMSKDIMPDFLHLSARGYAIWTEAITPTLTEMLKN